jgi:hypothetical protein
MFGKVLNICPVSGVMVCDKVEAYEGGPMVGEQGIGVKGWKGVGPRLIVEWMGLKGEKGDWSCCDTITIGVGGGKLSSLRRSGDPDNL